MKKIIIFFLLLSLLAIPVQGKTVIILGAGQVTTASGPLNVRSGPSTAYSISATLPKGSFVLLEQKTGAWYKVWLDQNRTGYVHSSYITPAGTPAAVTASALNVRKGAGKTYGVQGYLHNGDQVAILSTSGDWAKVVYHGTKTGYVSRKYLSGYTAGVSLSVPYYSQTDGRWANVTLGSSGKTMAKIGCATTAIAMLESYRNGQTIYPDTMARRLKYTSTGSVYWPADYKVVTTFNLNAIKNLLDQGKPVLFGARNTYGTQHWVVITGYSGSGGRTADFIINDPGVSSRTRLDQFLVAYPQVYKYFHY